MTVDHLLDAHYKPTWRDVNAVLVLEEQISVTSNWMASLRLGRNFCFPDVRARGEVCEYRLRCIWYFTPETPGPLHPSFPLPVYILSGSEPRSSPGGLLRGTARLLNSTSLAGSLRSPWPMHSGQSCLTPALHPGPQELSLGLEPLILLVYKGSSGSAEGQNHRYRHMLLQRKHMLLLLNSLPKWISLQSRLSYSW